MPFMPIYKTDSDRIIENFKRTAEYHLDRDRPLMAVRSFVLALRDARVCSLEAKAAILRHKLTLDIDEWNSQSRTYRDIDSL